jgi:hypothetical protein
MIAPSLHRRLIGGETKLNGSFRTGNRMARGEIGRRDRRLGRDAVPLYRRHHGACLAATAASGREPTLFLTDHHLSYQIVYSA